MARQFIGHVKGEDGYTPRKGVDYFDGEKGDPGQDGADGITPHIGENGNWFIGDRDTGQPVGGSGGGVSDEQVSTIVERKIAQSINSVSNPFETAYWKDSVTNKIYLVNVENGVLTVTENSSDTPPAEELEGLLTDRLLLWHDEFDGTELNTDNWNIAYGYARNGEIHNRVADAISVENSCFIITATKLEEAETIDNRTFTWHSGEVSSKFNFDGDFYMEFKYRLVADTTDSSVISRKGFCPAIWMMGDAINGINWPICGEEDMMESPTYNGVASTCHYGGVDGLHVAGGVSGGVNNIDWSVFHTQAIERAGNTLRYIFDGNVYAEKDFGEVASGFYDGINPFTKYALQIIMNIAVGGTASSSATVEERGDNPASMMVDWVRVYSAQGVTERKNPTVMDLDNIYKGIDKCTFENNVLTIHKGDMVQLYPIWDNEPVNTKYKTSSSDASVASTYNAVFSSETDNFPYIGATEVGSANVTITETVNNLETVVRVNVIENEFVKTEDTLETLDLYDAKYWRFGDISTSGVINESFVNNTIHTIPIKVESGRTYVIKGSTKIIPLKSSDIILGSTSYNDVLCSDGVKDLSSKEEWTAPYDCNYVILRNQNVDSSLRARHFSRCLFLFAKNLQFAKEDVEVACTNIVIDKSELTFTDANSQRLTTTLTPANCNQIVTWSTSDTSIATVLNGVVTPKSQGNCIITATCGSESATCSVTVSEIQADESIIAEWNGESDIPSAFNVGSSVIEQNETYGNVLAFRGSGGNTIGFTNDTEDNTRLRSLEITFWLDGVSNAASSPMCILTLCNTNTLSSINTLSSYGLMANITKGTTDGHVVNYTSNSKIDGISFEELHTLKLYSNGDSYFDGEKMSANYAKTNYYWGNKINLRAGICLTKIKYKYEE